MTEELVSPTLGDATRRYAAAATAAHALVAAMSDDAFHRPLPDGGWSVGECLEHLVVSGGKMAAKLEAAAQVARADERFAEPDAARAPVRLGWLARLFIAGTGPGVAGRNPPMKVRTRPPFEPGDPQARGRGRQAILGDFLALQERLLADAHAADGLDLAGVMVASVLAGWIRIPLGGWFLAIAGHQERHLEQARRAHAVIASESPGVTP